MLFVFCVLIDGRVDSDIIVTYKGKILMTVIPAEGEVTRDQITSQGGWCYRGCQGEWCRFLRTHFDKLHPEGAVLRSGVDIIPPDGDIAVENLTTRVGFCLYGCNKEITRTRSHFDGVHMNHWNTLLWSIPHDGQVYPEELGSHSTGVKGYCFMPGCDGKCVKAPKDHFVGFHLGETWTCPRCGKAVKNVPQARCRHMAGHSGPAFCDVPGCNHTGSTSIAAVWGHISTNHPGFSQSLYRLMDAEEVAGKT